MRSWAVTRCNACGVTLPAASAAAPAPAVPRSTAVAQAVAAVVLVALTSLGIADGALPELLRLEVAPVTALVLACITLAHHRTLQAAQDALAATAGVAEAAAPAAALPGAPAWLATAGRDAAEVMAEVGAGLEASRAGVLLAPVIPAQPAPPAAAYPPPVASATVVPTPGV